MAIEKIYSFRATAPGCRVSGRICAVDMDHATEQVLREIAGYGPMNVRVTELLNQARAMKKWQQQGNK